MRINFRDFLGGVAPAAAGNAQEAKPAREPSRRRRDTWVDLNKRLTPADVWKLGGGDQAMAPRPVRTRFAPSPTGDLHIGSCMIGVLNYLAAKRMGGEF